MVLLVTKKTHNFTEDPNILNNFFINNGKFQTKLNK